MYNKFILYENLPTKFITHFPHFTIVETFLAKFLFVSFSSIYNNSQGTQLIYNQDRYRTPNIGSSQNVSLIKSNKICLWILYKEIKIKYNKNPTQISENCL